MSQLKRRKQDNSFEVVGDKSMPIRYLADGTPSNDDYVVIDKGSGARKTTIQDLYDSAERMDLLWENASPSSDFAAQTVALDLTNYSHVSILYKASGSITRMWESTHRVGNDIMMPIILNSTIHTRTLALNDSGIVFNNSLNISTYGTSGSILNSSIIPYRIYGIK